MSKTNDTLALLKSNQTNLVAFIAFALTSYVGIYAHNMYKELDKTVYVPASEAMMRPVIPQLKLPAVKAIWSK